MMHISLMRSATLTDNASGAGVLSGVTQKPAKSPSNSFLEVNIRTREPYTRVWTLRLSQLASWIAGETHHADGLKFAFDRRNTAPHAWRTWQKCGASGFESWFTNTVNRIVAQGSPSGRGNFRKFVAELIRDLMRPNDSLHKTVRNSLVSGDYGCVMLKRAWMLAMFLRRDQGIIKCLLERHVQRVEGGPDAQKSWYVDNIFPEAESELPVDKRIMELGRELFEDLGMTKEQIADAAHRWGLIHRRAPSVLDALFFAMD